MWSSIQQERKSLLRRYQLDEAYVEHGGGGEVEQGGAARVAGGAHEGQVVCIQWST